MYCCFRKTSNLIVFKCVITLSLLNQCFQKKKTFLAWIWRDVVYFLLSFTIATVINRYNILCFIVHHTHATSPTTCNLRPTKFNNIVVTYMVTTEWGAQNNSNNKIKDFLLGSYCKHLPQINLHLENVY